MKRFPLALCLLIPVILAMTGPAPAGPEAMGTIEYTFHPCEIDSKRSSRLIARERVKRILAADLAAQIEQEARLRDVRLTEGGVADLPTFLVQVEIADEKWDGTLYTLKARRAGGMDDLLQIMRILQEERHIEQELVSSGRRVDAILQEIDDINRELRETRVERPKMDRYYRSLEELEAANGYARGLILLACGRLPEALEALTESIERDHGKAGLFYYRGMTHAKMGDDTKALTDYDRAIGLDRCYAAPRLARGEILHAQGFHEEALVELQAAVNIDPKLTKAHLLRGIVYGLVGRNRQAIGSLTTTIALDPGLAIAYVHRGNAYSKMGYHRQAFSDYNRAISLDDRMWIAHFHLGALHQRRRSYSKARDEYGKVLELNDRCSLAYANRGRARAKLGEEEKALVDYDRAIELDPGLAVAYFNRGLTRMKLGHMERALEDQKMAARLGWKAAQDFLSAKGIRW
jgi:tetratricopeptide (TPR) repeat protein